MRVRPHRRWLNSALCGLLLAATVSTPPSARANETAVKLYERGVELFEQKRYRTAIAIFKEAYSLDPAPSFKFNIARCHESLGEWNDALASYYDYLRISPNAPNRAEVETLVTRLKVKLTPTHSQVFVSTLPAVGVRILDAKTGKHLGTTPVPDLWLPFGRHVLSLNKDGFVPQQTIINSRSGSSPRVAFRLVAENAPGFVKLLQLPRGAKVVINERAVKTPGPSSGYSVPPGIAEVLVTYRGATFYQGRVRVGAGRTALVPLGRSLAMETRPTPGQPVSDGLGAGFWATLAVGVAGFVVAGGLYGAAHDKAAEARSYAASEDRERLVYEQLRSDAEGLHLGGSITIGLAAASSAAALVLGILAATEDSSSGAVEVGVSLSGASLGVSF